MSSAIKASAILSFLTSITSVSAHGFVQGIDVAGTYYTGYLVNQYPWQSNPPSSIAWAEQATDLGFVAPDAYSSPDIICHRSSTNAALSATVSPGQTIRMDWNTWPDSHHGPVIDYLAPCSNGDCSTIDKTTLSFVKIAESGLLDNAAAPGTWASDQLIRNNNSWTITIPQGLKKGKYVLRHEIIALHSADLDNGAQNYPQCVNLEVVGEGTMSIEQEGTRGMELYTPKEDGILVNIWWPAGQNYRIPGPKLWTGASSASGGASVSVTSAPTVVTSVPTTMATVMRPAATSSVEPAETSAPGEEGDDDTCEL